MWALTPTAAGGLYGYPNGEINAPHPVSVMKIKFGIVMVRVSSEDPSLSLVVMICKTTFAERLFDPVATRFMLSVHHLTTIRALRLLQFFKRRPTHYGMDMCGSKSLFWIIFLVIKFVLELSHG